MNVNKILVPLDSSDHSALALQLGISLAQKYGAQLLLLHVIPRAVEEVATQGHGAHLHVDPPMEGTTLPYSLTRRSCARGWPHGAGSHRRRRCSLSMSRRRRQS